MYRENYIASLRSEIVETVAEHLSPVSSHYGYSDVPLETNIRWRPMVLIIGNYSSGKSSLINEFLGTQIQATGQAPTDDSFTVITYDDSVGEDEPIHVTEERDGKALLNDPEYPFTTLKKHGQRFASHFRLKKVNSPFLKDLAIIDTPGMLDSITERDRGYDYQEVVGDLAQKADLVLVLFDAHKAGTIREAYKSIRETLTANTFEDRIIFVLNRIDECTCLDDLLRVYGALCWNLSQITGRKDIPLIHMTYSPHASGNSHQSVRCADYLPLLENQREQLKKIISRTPRRRLDHLATFVETHGERLTHYLEALSSFRKATRAYRTRMTLKGFLVSLLAGGVAAFALMAAGLPDPILLLSVGGGVAGIFMLLWIMAIQGALERKYHQKMLENLDTLTDQEDQTRRDTWGAVKNIVYNRLKKGEGRYSYFEIKRDLVLVRRAYLEASEDIRKALSEIAAMHDDDSAEFETPGYLLKQKRKREEEFNDEMRMELMKKYMA